MGKSSNEVPLQSQKADIVNTLVGINDNMRLFSDEVEGKLEKAYQALGGSKKFGYDPTTKDVSEFIMQDKLLGGLSSQDRNVNKIFKHATVFLET